MAIRGRNFFLGQSEGGQVDFLRPTELDGVAAGELRLLQKLAQIAQRLVTAFLGAVQDILDAEICLRQYRPGSVRFVEQIVAAIHAVKF